MHDLTSKPFTDKANFPNPETDQRQENLECPKTIKLNTLVETIFFEIIFGQVGLFRLQKMF